LRTAETRRVPSAAVPAEIKTHNYLNGILARLELRGSDADEVILRDVEGYVTEGATSNLFFVADGTLRTPTTRLDILPGVTRGVVLDLARSEGIPVEAGEYTLADLRRADEAFVTNTTWEVRPVTRVDDASLEVGPLTKLLAGLFDERVEAAHY
jgi:branched-chain amino acid aminotransferase